MGSESIYITVKTRVSLWHIWCHIRTDLRSFTEILCEYDTFGCCSDTLVLQYSLQASIAELASTAATDVGMHGLLASQSCYPLVCVHYGPVVDFFITKQTSLHPFDFVRNLFHLLVIITNDALSKHTCFPQ